MLTTRKPEQPLLLSEIVHQWTEARAALATTLSKYLDLCSAISHASHEAKALHASGDLVSRIESTLGPRGFHSVLVNQLVCSQAALARARNKLASHIFRLPDELLSVVFSYVITDYDPEVPIRLERRVKTFYRRLYTLLGVSSIWKNVGVGTPKLWNLVPSITTAHFSTSNLAITLSLRRSGRLPLDLAVILYHKVPPELLRALLENIPRIRSINIVAEGSVAIQDIIYPLLEHKVTESLSELSVCTPGHRGLMLGSYYIYHPESPHKDRVLGLMRSLTRFRLHRSALDWSHISFSARLVELRLQKFTIGPDLQLIRMMRAIGTAVKLQTLGIIKTASFPEPGLENIPVVSLPDLQLLLVEDLYSNTLSIVLKSIASRSHKLELFLTDKSALTVSSPRNPSLTQVTPSYLHELLVNVHIHTLLLSGEQVWWKDFFDIQYVLSALPLLRTLKLSRWTFDEQFCAALKISESILEPVEQNSSPLCLPDIHEWHITHAKIADEQGFQDIMLRHKVRKLLLHGSLNHGLPDFGLDDWQCLTGKEQMSKWLDEHIPEFTCLTGQVYCNPPESRSEIWQL